MGNKKHKIGVVGNGMVGGALLKYFKDKANYETFVYDKGKGEGSMAEINKADLVYVCVPTPFKNGKCDSSIIEEVIGNLIGNKIVVIRSTVIPGTTEKLQDKYQQHKLIFNPEFLTELTSDQDMSFPDRQIIGYTDKSYPVTKDVLLQMPLAPYERIVPAKEAEMIKYATNVWFATKVTYANHVYDLCEKIGLDYKTVLEGLAADKRIGRTHLKVLHKEYRGYGGKCLPKDLKALIAFAEEIGVDVPVFKNVDYYNDELLKSQGLDPLDTDKGTARTDSEKSYVSAKEIRQKKQ